jgi:ribonuclease Y
LASKIFKKEGEDYLSLFEVLVIILVPVSFFLGFILKNKFFGEKLPDKNSEKLSKKLPKEIIEKAEVSKKEIILEGMEQVHKFRIDAEKEISERRREIQFQEKRLMKKEETYERKLEFAANKEKESERKLKQVNEKFNEIENIKIKQIEKLEAISRLSRDEAKKIIIENLQDKLVHEKAEKIREFEQNLKEEKDEIAKKIVCLAIQRCSANHSSETTISVVTLPNEDMKGRIIGREGRNIRSIENLTGVDLIIDDTPEAITISAFDPMRREIARIALMWLMSDGRIHPAKIEEAVKLAEEEIEKTIKEEGQQAVLEVGIRGIHPDLVRLIGRLKYRTSYGQNMLSHSIETACIAGLIASELKLDVVLAKRCGLLHDIGKALSYETEGSHVDIGVDVLRKYKEDPKVIHAVAAHHGDIEVNNEIDILVQASDAISAARPGARRENLENYIKRLHKLETLVTEFSGVERCYAVQAGREIRVMISPEYVSDDEMVVMGREICKKIESDLIYPGQIKVNIIRESRVCEVAK